MSYRILITNDDGYRSPGIIAITEALRALGHVTVVAPSAEKSAISHALTLNSPLRIHQVEADVYAVDGTPADCVLVAMNKILGRTPDLVVSGINAGANVGDDVMYSGTVAAAREGSMYGCRAVAFSLKHAEMMDFPFWAEYASALCGRVLTRELPGDGFLNINFPAIAPKGVKITRLSRKFARSSLYENNDPRGKKYYWIGDDESQWDEAPDTDFWALMHGFISITPLQRDTTDYSSLDRLAEFTKD